MPQVSGVAKRKTTVYLDADVLTATKAAALTSRRTESAVIEEALRTYLRSGHGEALAQAVEEVHAVRRARRFSKMRGE